MLNRFVIGSAAFVSISITGFSSCSGSGGADSGTMDPELICDAAPPATAFAKVYSDVFIPSCLGTCHKPGAADGSDFYGLYNTEANALMQVNKASNFTPLKVVDPNNLANSSMWLKVLAREKSPAGKGIGAKMPKDGTLTTAQKTLLRDWICSGAK